MQIYLSIRSFRTAFSFIDHPFPSLDHLHSAKTSIVKMFSRNISFVRLRIIVRLISTVVSFFYYYRMNYYFLWVILEYCFSDIVWRDIIILKNRVHFVRNQFREFQKKTLEYSDTRTKYYVLYVFHLHCSCTKSIREYKMYIAGSVFSFRSMERRNCHSWRPSWVFSRPWPLVLIINTARRYQLRWTLPVKEMAFDTPMYCLHQDTRDHEISIINAEHSLSLSSSRLTLFCFVKLPSWN